MLHLLELIAIIMVNNKYSFSYAKGVGSEHMSTSAKTGLGVNEVFANLA